MLRHVVVYLVVKVFGTHTGIKAGAHRIATQFGDLQNKTPIVDFAPMSFHYCRIILRAHL